MFTSLQKLARPAVAAALLSFTTAPSSVAQTTAGKAVVQITPEANPVVVSSADYHATLLLTCSATQGYCLGNYPMVGAKRRLTLTRMSCYMRSSTYATYAVGQIKVEPTGSITEYLPVDHTTDHGFHVLNRAVDVRVGSGKNAYVSLQLASGGQALEGYCTAHGTLETLQ